jgi:hypothetical protein
MSGVLLNFKHSYSIIPFIIVFTLLVTFIDSKVTGEEHNIAVYIKQTIFVIAISIFLIYISTIQGYVQEEILTGNPPF